MLLVLLTAGLWVMVTLFIIEKRIKIKTPHTGPLFCTEDIFLHGFFSGKETSPDGTVSDDSRKMWSQSLVIRGSRLEKLKMHAEQGTGGEILQE